MDGHTPRINLLTVAESEAKERSLMRWVALRTSSLRETWKTRSLPGSACAMTVRGAQAWDGEPGRWSSLTSGVKSRSRQLESYPHPELSHAEFVNMSASTSKVHVKDTKERAPSAPSVAPTVPCAAVALQAKALQPREQGHHSLDVAKLSSGRKRSARVPRTRCPERVGGAFD